MELALLTYWQGQQRRIMDMLEPQIPESRKVALQMSFWNDETKRLLAIILPLLQSGAEEAVMAEAALAGIEVDWTAAITEASKWARQYAGELVDGITDTTKERIRSIVANWMETEHTFPQLWRQLVADQGFSQRRAKLIAATETTKAYAEGKMIGVETIEKQGYFEYEKQWQTARDDNVCLICKPMQGKTAKGVRGAFDTLAGQLEGPPAHPGCRCWHNMIPKVPK